MTLEHRLKTLENSWDEGKTPHWIRSFVHAFKEIYEDCDKSLGSSNNAIDKNLILMSLQKSLQTICKENFDAHSFDLKQVQNHCAKFYKYYEQIDEDDRDVSMEDTKTEVDEVFNDVNTTTESLLQDLSTASGFAYVKLRIAMGNVEDDKALDEHLLKINTNERERLMQEIRCIQLLRLLNAMKESLLDDENPMNGELTDLLVRAYQLIDMEGRDPGATEPIPKPEPTFYGEARQEVENLISASIAKLDTLEQVKETVENKFKKELGPMDKVLIENKFKECCLKLCKLEISKSVKTMFQGKDEKFVLKMFKSLDAMQKIDEIPFTSLDYYKKSLESLMSSEEEKDVLDHFKSKCLELVILNFESIKQEVTFLTCLTDFLCHSKSLIPIFNELGVDRFGKKPLPELKDLLEKIKNIKGRDSDSKLAALQDITEPVQQQNNIFLASKIMETIASFAIPNSVSEIRTGDRSIVEVRGKHVVLSEVLKEVERKVAARSANREVHFLGEQAFHLDASLSKDTWHGMNVAVRSKLIHVHRTVTWNVSGLDNNFTFEENAGTDSAGNGYAGSCGRPGESGGNVLILAEKVNNAHLLSIISNGGRGSNGQDGGNGWNGQNGVGISQSEMEQNFPSPVNYGNAFSGKPTEQINIIVNKFSRVWIKAENKFNCYYEGQTVQGNEVILSFTWSPAYRAQQCYFLYRGSPGKPGGLGGQFGLGGKGGFPGQITVKHVKNGSNYGVKKTAIQGADGRTGLGGLNGKMGKQGWDMAYNHRSYWNNVQFYGTNLNSKLIMQQSNGLAWNTVYCWRNDNNIYFQSYTLPSPSQSETRNSKGNSGSSLKAIMKKPINGNSLLAKQPNQLDSAGPTISQIENLHQQAMEKAKTNLEEQISISSEFKTYHIISHNKSYKPKDEQLFKTPDVSNRNIATVGQTLKNIESVPTNTKNWMKIGKYVLNRQQLDTLSDNYKILKNQPPSKELEIVEQIWLQKHRFITLEKVAAAVSELTSIETSESDVSPTVTVFCLEETSNIPGSLSNSKLGKLSDYLLESGSKEQNDKLLAFCKEIDIICDEKFVHIFIEEYADLKGIQINTKDSNLHQIDELMLALHEKMSSDNFFRQLHQHYANMKNKQMQCGSSVENEQFINTFYESIVRRGPLSKCYRELLAKGFSINIRMFAQNGDGIYQTFDNHNPEASEVINLLCKGNAIVQLFINKEHLQLEVDRRQKMARYWKIMVQAQSFDTVEQLDGLAEQPLVETINLAAYQSLATLQTQFDNAVIDSIADFHSKREKPKVKEWLELLASRGVECQKVLLSIQLRFSNEGKHLATDELHFFVNKLLSSVHERRNEEDLFRWIVSSCQQQHWTRELMLLQLENYFKKQLQDKASWREHLSRMTNRGIIILLSAKLERDKRDGSITEIRMGETLQMLSLVTQKVDNLFRLDLTDWFYALEELYCRQRIGEISTWRQKDGVEKLNQASYYAIELINKYGLHIANKLFDALKAKNIAAAQNADVVDIFFNIYNGKWIVGEPEIGSLTKSESLELWMKDMAVKFEDDKQRDISTLIKMIKGSGNTSVYILDMLERLKFSIYASSSTELSQVQDDGSMLSTARMLARVNAVIFKERGFWLRDTQKLSAMTLLQNNRHTLGQVATGEGKTLILVAVAIIKAKRGEKVDIITSSSVLAKRDAEENEPIYSHFGINVAHNCDENIEKRKKAYSECQVVYGDLASFQRDHLLHSFYQKNVLGDRKADNVIVDEVDCMLLDRGNNILYLSHDLPDVDKLEPVYVFIWHWINSSNVLSTEAIKSAVLWHMHGVITMDDIGKLDAGLDEFQRARIWNGLINTSIIDRDGKLLTESVDGRKLASLLGQDLAAYRDRLEYVLNNCINREKCFQIPNYLKPFLELHLEAWIESAKIAYCMEVDQDYVVDVDRSKNRSDQSPNITILDRDTGTDMINSQWEAALHQFIQLKHGCKISLQSLKAVFISNVTFFKLYQHLYGLTGTLGSHRERDLLQEIYDVDFVYMPTAKAKRFYEYLPIIRPNHSTWIDEIVKRAHEITKDKNCSVLIICETVKQVFILQKAFKDVETPNVRTYTRDYEKFNIKELPPQHIIIATNLAGRGTDIKISNELRNAGGLHVCLSYLPRNIRIEQQAFGRTARAGDRGTGRLIIKDTGSSAAVEGSSRILHLKQERDSRELHRLSQIKKYYETQIKTEEKWFREFSDQYNKLRTTLQTGQVTKDNEQLRQVLLRSCLDKWAYWLDVNSSDIQPNSTVSPLPSFINQLKLLKTDQYDSLRDWAGKSLSQMVKLGQCLLSTGEIKTALAAFDFVIKHEPYFAEAAHYYKALALSQKNLSDSEVLDMFTQELCKAVALFEDRKAEHMAHAALIDSIKTDNRANIIQISGFVDQKKNICAFYSRLITSVENILGHPVTPDVFHESNNDKTPIYDIFDVLLQDGILTKPKIVKNIPKHEINRISFEFGLSGAELLQFLETYRSEQGESIKMSDFMHAMNQTLNIPCREQFWNSLVEQNVLCNEMSYVIFDSKPSEEFSEAFIKITNSELSEVEFTLDKNEIVLLPSTKLSQTSTIFEQAKFKATVGELSYNTLKERGVFVCQRKAMLNPNVENVCFKNFDSISVKDFERLNISSKDAKLILNELVKSGIITQSACSDDAYSLAVAFNKISTIQLGSFKIYERDVKDLLTYCCSFRIALQGLLKQASPDYEIPLVSSPHRALVAELFTSQILKPVMVGEMSLSSVPTSLSKLKLDKKTLDNIQRNLRNLKGSIRSLDVDTIMTHGTRHSTIDEWYLFTLNGLDVLLAHDTRLEYSEYFNWFDLTKSTALGNAQITVSYLMGCKTKSMSSNARQFEEGYRILFSSLESRSVLSNFHSLANFSLIMRLTSLNARFMMSTGARLNKYGIKVIVALPSRVILEKARRITQTVAHSLNVELDNKNFYNFIYNRLQTLCEHVSKEISLIIKNLFETIVETLKKLGCKQSNGWNSAAQTVLSRQTYFDNIRQIFEEMAHSILDSLTIEAKKSGNTNFKVTFDPITSVEQRVHNEYYPALKESINTIINDLNKNVVDITKNPPREGSTSKCIQPIEETVQVWQERLQSNVANLLNQYITDSVVTEGPRILMQHLKQKEQILFEANTSFDSVARFFKLTRTEQLRNETDTDSESDSGELTVIENILDIQFDGEKKRNLHTKDQEIIKCGQYSV